MANKQTDTPKIKGKREQDFRVGGGCIRDNRRFVDESGELVIKNKTGQSNFNALRAS